MTPHKNMVSDCCSAEIHKHRLIKCDEWGYDCVCGNKKAKCPICQKCWNKCTPVAPKEGGYGIGHREPEGKIEITIGPKEICEHSVPVCDKCHPKAPPTSAGWERCQKEGHAWPDSGPCASCGQLPQEAWEEDYEIEKEKFLVFDKASGSRWLDDKRLKSFIASLLSQKDAEIARAREEEKGNTQRRKNRSYHRGIAAERERLRGEIEEKAFVIKHGGAIDLDLGPLIKKEDILSLLTPPKEQ